MTVVVESKTTRGISNGSDTVTLSKPSGTVDGDLLVALLSTTQYTYTISSVPAGWTLIRHDSDATYNGALYSYYKIASSEGSSYDFVFADTGYSAGTMLRISGYKVSDPDGDSDGGDYQANDATPTFSATTVTPTITSSLLILVVASKANGGSGTSGYAIATNNPSWTEQFDSFAASNSRTFAVATALRPETTATGSPSVTFDSADAASDSFCQLVVINRDNALTATITDTTSLTDSDTAFGDLGIGGTDIQYVTDDVVADGDNTTAWNTQDKNISVWSTQDKS